MVRARRDFLDKGYYDRFIAAVADAAAEFTPPEATVLDAGCGEGIYSLAVLRAIEKAGKHGELLGVDISKTALQYASKRSPDFTLCVACRSKTAASTRCSISSPLSCRRNLRAC